MSQERKILSVPVTPELKADLNILADADRRPVASYARLQLERIVREARNARPELFKAKKAKET